MEQSVLRDTFGFAYYWHRYGETPWWSAQRQSVIIICRRTDYPGLSRQRPNMIRTTRVKGLLEVQKMLYTITGSPSEKLGCEGINIFFCADLQCCNTCFLTFIWIKPLHSRVWRVYGWTKENTLFFNYI